MGKNLAAALTEVAVAKIVHHGEQLILPESLSIDGAIDLLERRKKYLTEEVAFSEAFDVFPWDGAHAFARVLENRYGWAPAEATPGFFGDTPPKMISIEVGPGEVESVPWGAFSLPNVTGKVQCDTSYKDERIIFAIKAAVLRKDEEVVRGLFKELREYLRKNSIYRGKAIKIRFRDNNGDMLPMPEPKFIDTSSINEELLVYSDSVQAAIETNLFTPIQRVADCKANGIPVKRGVLLGGTYGTGKTLAAHVASKLAVQCGVTFLYVPRADELADAIEFAKQYQDPACVIFCEDIDRAMNGERSVEMDDILNIIDGIDTKTTPIITVLTTNDLYGINPAMLRPGRLDAVIEVAPPDARAVQKLLRLYGGNAIDADTDLTRVGKILDGNIPAVIAEVVKRAKLAEVRRTEPGKKVTRLSEEALIEAANTMQMQLKLLAPKQAEKLITMDDLVVGALSKALNGSKEKIEEIHSVVTD